MNPHHVFAAAIDAPLLHQAWHRLHECARDILDRHTQTYATQISRGERTQADANAKLAVLHALVEQWRRVVSPEALPDPADYRVILGASSEEIRAKLESLDQLACRQRDADPNNKAAELKAYLIAALLWHQTPVQPRGGVPHLWTEREYAIWTQKDMAA